jgi:hypothetical protein
MVQAGWPKAELALTDEEGVTLERMVRRRKSAQAMAMRARIVGGEAATGMSQTAISRICRAFGLQPWRSESFMLSTKVGLYLDRRSGQAQCRAWTRRARSRRSIGTCRSKRRWLRRHRHHAARRQHEGGDRLKLVWTRWGIR